MKPKSIRRDVQSRSLRQNDRGFNPGRMNSVRESHVPPGGARPSRGSRRKEQSSPEDASRRKTVMRVWSVVLVTASALIIAGFMGFWLKSHRVHRNALHAEAAALREELIRVASKFESPGETEALDLVRRALAVRDPDQVASLFRLGGAEPAEVVSYLRGADERDGRMERMDWLGSMDVSGQQADGVFVVYSGKQSVVERLAFLVPDDAGDWKMDFESFARTSRPELGELSAGRADHARVRVLMARDSYYNGPYIDETRWSCYGMVSMDKKGRPDEDTPLLHGYCRVNSPQAKALETIFDMGRRATRVTLEIRRAEGAGERQFEISRVLAEDWVLSPKPFDERFK